MKSSIYGIGVALMLVFGGLSIGCGNTENSTEQHDSHEHGEYKCPMDCEAGKTYEEPGKCPVCKMDLAEIESA